MRYAKMALKSLTYFDGAESDIMDILVEKSWDKVKKEVVSAFG